MTALEAFKQLWLQLSPLYEKAEANLIAEWTIEHITGEKRNSWRLNDTIELNYEQTVQLNTFTEQLLQHQPIQYVLAKTWFYKLSFYVNKNVLIPRPETEELVEWVLKDTATVTAVQKLKLLDIGTGSGCIPIALKKNNSSLDVYSCDNSERALEVAQKNAAIHQVNINFYCIDFLNKEETATLPIFDVLISNPPYIPLQEKATMPNNVVLHEPHQALFVPNHLPLLFYETIIRFSRNHLKQNGWIYAEIHENYGSAVKQLFLNEGFSVVEIKKDLQGKERMLRAQQ